MTRHSWYGAFPEFRFHSRRSPVFALGGMVAASQPLAVRAGLSMLERGGSAADAAVAVAAVLAVVEPCSTGLGGDAFALYFDRQTRAVRGLNGSGRCASALSMDVLRREGLDKGLPPTHAHTVTTPGACAAWCDLSARFGRLPLAEVLEPARRLAEEGFVLGPVTAELWREGVPKLSRTAGGAQLLIDGRAPLSGEIMRNPSMARVLATVAEGGKKAFYQGEIAQAIVAAVREEGGLLSEKDLAAHHSEWVEPASTVYRGARMHECPPNGQGLAALIALNILSETPAAFEAGPMEPRRWHCLIEALRLAFADARRYIADPARAEVPLAGLLDRGYAHERAKRIDLDRAHPEHPAGKPLASSDTVYFSVVDGQGDACSMVNSNYMGFGTGIVPRGLGFSLQNRGYNFSLEPGHPNVLEPGKRPYHTIIPAMTTREEDGSLHASLGVMGGFMQPQGHVQVLTALLDDEVDPQAALDRPRFCLTVGRADSPLVVEDGAPEALVEGLEALGHSPKLVRGYARAVFGRGQIILREPSTGVLAAGSDPRADGLALGF